MSAFSSYRNKRFTVRLQYVQILFVFLAFGLMVFASYILGVNIEGKHLQREADAMLENLGSKLAANLRNAEEKLDSVYETVRELLLQGYGFDEAKKYITEVTDAEREKGDIAGFAGAFALFDIFGGQVINGAYPDVDWLSLPDWDSKGRPWYAAADNSSGDTVVTDPYIDKASGEFTLTYVRCIYDDNGDRLAIVCIDILLERIHELLSEDRGVSITDWMLFDNNLSIIAHYDRDILGKQLQEVPGVLSEISSNLEMRRALAPRTAIHRLDKTRSLSVQQLENGWFLGVSTLAENYLQNVNNIQWILTIFGLFIATGLSIILVRIVAQRNKAEKRTEKLLGSMDTLLMVVEIETDRIIFVNERMKRDFGYPDSIVGKKCWEVLNEDGNSHERCPDCPKSDPALDSGEPVTHEHYIPILNKYYRTISRYIDWPGGSKVCLKQYYDITEIKDSIAEIREADEYTQLLLDSTPMSCTLWNRDLEIIDCNQKALDLFGVKDKQEFYKRFAEFSPEFQPNGENSVEASHTVLKRAFEENHIRIEWAHQRLNGEPLPCEVTLVRLRNKGEYLVAGYTRDLTEYKAFLADIEKAHENLRMARDAAEAASRTKSAFLANISHEIRTPMNSIIGFAELAQYDDISRKTGEYLKNIHESADWLLSIINDILDISKIESGKIELERIPFDLPDIFSQCESLISPKAKEKGISLYSFVESSNGVKLLGDPVRLRQALMNLLSNSIKFTNNGLVKFLATIIESDDNSITIHFEVKDSGIGMNPEQIEKIFDPFMQADDSITRKFGGTGLGLPISKNIIEMMGGALNVESAIGIGTRFYFDLTFELTDEVADKPSQELELSSIKKPRFSGEILVCEDNSMNQQVVCEHLARVGLETVVANNGKECVEIVANRVNSGEKPFDLIFMDIHMPEMGGMEAASIITDMGIKTPVVAMTANIMNNDLESYKACGMPDCIGKPFTSHELWKYLMKYLPVEGYSNIDMNLLPEENEKFIRQLQVHFVRKNQTKYDEIIKAVEAGDTKLAHRMAHTLKSNAGQIGEKRLQRAAAMVEATLSGGESVLGEEERSILKAELKSTLSRLESLLIESDKKTKTAPLSDVKIREIIEKLEPLLASNNVECMTLLDDIREIPGAEELAHNVEEFNFKQAIMELSIYKEKTGISV